MEYQSQSQGIKFDKTISLGHVFSVIMFLITAMVSWNVMDKRVLVLEEARTTQREHDTTRDVAIREKFQEVKDSLIDMRRSIDKVADKIGANK